MIEQTTDTQSENLAGKVRQTAEQVKESAHRMTEQIRDATSKKMTNLREQASEYYQSGKERAGAWEQQFEDYVRQKPIQALLIAAGVGIAAGLVVRFGRR